jgi:polysaccharide export outer membrane protein
MTLEQFEGEVVERLKMYIKQPEVAVNITQFRSQPVSVMGAVGKPGVLQLEGTKRLIEVLSLAGGVTREAGSRVKITRKLESGPIPLPSATVVGDYSLAEVDVRAIENATHPEDNIEILPNDIISVPRAQLVYVIGEGVKQPGGFTLNDRSSISLIEAVARAQGTVRGAALKSARIIRQGPGSNRVEIAVNMRDVYKGKGSDVMLQADDILYIPNNELKGTLRRSVDSVIQLSEAVFVYRGLGVY